MIEEIAAGKAIVDSIKAAITLSKELSSSRLIQDEIRDKLTQMSNQLMEAQGEALTLQIRQAELVSRNRFLEDEVERLKRWSVQAENYELKSINNMAFVYCLKGNVDSSETPHWLCQSCFDNCKKSVFQFMENELGYSSWLCPSCKCRIRTYQGATPHHPEG